MGSRREAPVQSAGASAFSKRRRKAASFPIRDRSRRRTCHSRAPVGFRVPLDVAATSEDAFGLVRSLLIPRVDEAAPDRRRVSVVDAGSVPRGRRKFHGRRQERGGVVVGALIDQQHRERQLALAQRPRRRLLPGPQPGRVRAPPSIPPAAGPRPIVPLGAVSIGFIIIQPTVIGALCTRIWCRRRSP